MLDANLEKVRSDGLRADLNSAFESLVSTDLPLKKLNRRLLLAGVTVIGADHLENRAWLFAPSGELIADYAKQHLVPGFVARFKPGDENLVRPIGGTRLGIAICKDMDFAQLGRAYSRLGVNAMLVPAYDFYTDAWYHASVAVLRGVEGGFSVVRSTRHGLLTISAVTAALSITKPAPTRPWSVSKWRRRSDPVR